MEFVNDFFTAGLLRGPLSEDSMIQGTKTGLKRTFAESRTTRQDVLLVCGGPTGPNEVLING